MLSTEDLLAGSQLTFEIEVPEEILTPGASPSGNGKKQYVTMRPLTVHDLQLISRATREQDKLMAVFMIQRSMVSPEMTVADVSNLHAGLMQFLLEHVNKISGITVSNQQLSTAIEEPIAKAAYIMAKEYGWTPQQVNDLTLGQILLHLKMLGEKQKA